MTDTHFEHHIQLILSLTEAAKHMPRLADTAPRDDADNEFLEDLQRLGESKQIDESFIARGQATLSRIVARYPELTPLAHRDLFWLFGGDCLHFMPDEEINIYQRLDERRFSLENEGKTFNFAEERAKFFDLN
jgi:hypothetical protein